MTPQQISSEAEAIVKRIVKLANEEIAMGNYKSLRRRYDIVFRDLALLVREIADWGAALTLMEHSDEGTKETENAREN